MYEIDKDNMYQSIWDFPENIIDAIKTSCRKVTKEITGKKPVTNIKLIRI